VGLMLLDAQGESHAPATQKSGGGGASKAAMKNASGMISKFLGKFKA